LLSDDGRYRYRLWRIWDAHLPLMAWVMLNPSTADADADDPTIKKCVGFAKANRHGGIVVVNLFAWRACNRRELRGIADAVGPENDAHIRWVSTASPELTVVAGWGSFGFARERASAVEILIRESGREIHCFRRSAGGHPWHPLYLPYSSSLTRL
jgi:hypothetical protein